MKSKKKSKKQESKTELDTFVDDISNDSSIEDVTLNGDDSFTAEQSLAEDVEEKKEVDSSSPIDTIELDAQGDDQGVPKLEPENISSDEITNLVMQKLQINTFEDFFSLYLSQEKSFEALALDTEFSSEDIEHCLKVVIGILGPEAVAKIEQEFEKLNEQDMSFGLLEPEEKEE